MKEWIDKLDDFLKISERDILKHPGKISHEDALKKAHAEYDKYHALHADDLTPVTSTFLKRSSK